MTNLFTPVSPDFFNPAKRTEDPSDQRMGHHIERAPADFELFCSSLKSGDFCILGYPDDRGVERNGGRTGALLGPEIIRKHLYKMTPSYSRKEWPRVVDLGDLRSWSHDLPLAHEEARKCIAKIRKQGAKIISLGGGHDWAFPDFVDFAKNSASKQKKIINIDAHLDMRPLPKDEKRGWQSGTPVCRINEENAQTSELSFATVGLQKHCNSQDHIEWAHSRRVTTMFLEDMPHNSADAWNLVLDRLELKQSSSEIGLSIDLDAFAQNVAPGVSAPQVFGLSPSLVSKFLSNYRDQISQLGIYEYNPNYDRDEQTARLAALLVYKYIQL